MTFVDAIKSGFKNYANFKGVAPRSEFWYWVLFGFLLQLVTSTLDKFVDGSTLSNLAQIALLLPGLAVAARRLRDAGHSPFWLLSWVAVIGSLVWLIATFATEYIPLFGDYTAAQLQAAIDQFDANQTGPIADAILSGTFNGSLAPLLVTSVLATATGITLLVFYCQPSKSIQQGNKYLAVPKQLPFDDGGTTA